MSTMMSDDFILEVPDVDSFQMWQGLVGAHYTPYVDDIGNLSWTNNGGLPNPATVNIAGKGLNIVGIVDADTDLPETANNFDAYLVGTESPYSAYIYDDGEWYNLGIIGKGKKGDKGDPGIGVPPGGTTGQVLKKASNADYDTEWGIAGEPATSAPLMDGTAAVGTSTKYAREDHVHPLYDQLVRPNLLDNWYFVGGGSQLGGGKFPINQRGQTSYSNNLAYTVDRWVKTGGSSALTVSSSGLSSTGAVLMQIINNVDDLLGKKLTISGLVNGSLGSAVVNVPGSIPSSWTRLARISFANSFISVDIDQTNSLQVLLELYSSDVCMATKLELGTTQTLAHQENGVWVLNDVPNYEEQLIRCKTSTADSSDTYANQTIVYEEPYHWGTGFQDLPNLESGQIDVYKMGRFAVVSIRFKCLTDLSWYTLPGITLTGIVAPASEVAAAMISRHEEFVCPLMIETNGTIHFDTARAGYWYTVTLCYMTV